MRKESASRSLSRPRSSGPAPTRPHVTAAPATSHGDLLRQLLLALLQALSIHPTLRLRFRPSLAPRRRRSHSTAPLIHAYADIHLSRLLPASSAALARAATPTTPPATPTAHLPHLRLRRRPATRRRPPSRTRRATCAQGTTPARNRVSSWPSRDPIGENGGFNLYGFVGNDGVNWWDILGRETPKSQSAEEPDPCQTCGSNWLPGVAFVYLSGAVLITSCNERSSARGREIVSTEAPNAGPAANRSKARHILAQSIKIRIRMYDDAVAEVTQSRTIDQAKLRALFDACVVELRACYSDLDKLDGLKREDLDQICIDLKDDASAFDVVCTKFHGLIATRSDGVEIGMAQYPYQVFSSEEQEELIRKPFQ